MQRSIKKEREQKPYILPAIVILSSPFPLGQILLVLRVSD